MKRCLILILTNFVSFTFSVLAFAQQGCPANLFEYELYGPTSFNLFTEGQVFAVELASSGGGMIYFTSLRVKNGSEDAGSVVTCKRMSIGASIVEAKAVQVRGMATTALALNFKVFGQMGVVSNFNYISSLGVQK